MLVYAIGFVPADADHSAGDFDWFPEAARYSAVAKCVERILEGGGDSVTFVPLDVPDGLSDEDVTLWIDGNRDLIEVGRDR